MCVKHAVMQKRGQGERHIPLENNTIRCDWMQPRGMDARQAASFCR